MNRFLNWTSTVLSALAVTASVLAPGRPGWAFAFGVASLLLAAAEFLQDPRRALLCLSYLPAFVLALTIYTFDGPAAGLVAFVAACLGLQGRLVFLRAADQSALRNRNFAADLEASLPPKVFVFIDVDIESEVERSSINEGHLVRVRPGDVIPCDGQVTYGSSFVDESPLGGDKEPRTKGMGSFVFAGSVNKNGSFLFRASGSAEQSHACRLNRALKNGFSFESLFTPSLFILEGLVGLAAITVFLIDSAALNPLLSVFLASSGAAFTAAAWSRQEAIVARGAAEGAAWKSRDSLEEIASAESVLAGAPGVLTEGRLRLEAIEGSGATGEDGALRLMGPLARRLESEAAFSVLRELQLRNIPLELIDAFTPMPGGGAGLVTGEEVRWVDLDTARLEGVPMAAFEAFARDHTLGGRSVVLLLRENRAAAAFSFADKILPQASSGLSLLSREDIPFLLVAPEAEANIKWLKDEFALHHVHADAGAQETESLRGRLEADGLHPLYILAPGARITARAGPSVAGAHLPSELTSAADAVVLKADLYGVARLLRLARRYGQSEKSSFLWAVAAQLALVGLSIVVDPRLIAIAALLPGWWLQHEAASLAEFRP